MRKPSDILVRARSASRRLAGLIAVAVVLVGMLASNTTFWWCSAMQTAHAAACCCCPEEAPEIPTAEVTVRQAECCERVDVGDVPPAGAGDPAPRVAPMAWITMPSVGIVDLAPRRSAVLPHATLVAPDPGDRGPPAPGARRALLQVFHC